MVINLTFSQRVVQVRWIFEGEVTQIGLFSNRPGRWFFLRVSDFKWNFRTIKLQVQWQRGEELEELPVLVEKIISHSFALENESKKWAEQINTTWNVIKLSNWLWQMIVSCTWFSVTVTPQTQPTTHGTRAGIQLFAVISPFLLIKPSMGFYSFARKKNIRRNVVLNVFFFFSSSSSVSSDTKRGETKVGIICIRIVQLPSLLSRNGNWVKGKSKHKKKLNNFDPLCKSRWFERNFTTKCSNSGKGLKFRIKFPFPLPHVSR